MVKLILMWVRAWVNGSPNGWPVEEGFSSFAISTSLLSFCDELSVFVNSLKGFF
jgi:hypothetical protein